MNKSAEIAAGAARLVVEEGLEYGAAKRKVARAMGGRPGDLPPNEQVEDEVRSYIALFCADTQPLELAALRRLGLRWMERLAEFRPHLSGAVWRGTATRQSSLHLDLFCDDPKAAEIGLINLGIGYDVATGPANHRGEPMSVLSLASRSPELDEPVTVHLSVHDLDDLRGALKPDAGGRTWRGDMAGVRRLLEHASS
jgi:hypothetical protein